MAISPLSSIGLRQNSKINFTSRKNIGNIEEYKPENRKGTDLSKMPVIILLATVPSNALAKNLNDIAGESSANKTEIGYTKENKSEPSTYVIKPETQKTQQSNAPYKYESLKYQQINYEQKFKAMGREYNLLFASNGSKDNAQYVYVIPANSDGNRRSEIFPPEVQQLIHHDIGEGDFCGAVITEDLTEKGTDKYRGTFRYELKLPDEVAQKIVDLVTGHSDIQNSTQIRINTVEYPNLLPPKLYE